MASVIRSGTRGEWTWPHGREGLLLLLQAHECASDSGSDEWDFALEMSSLQKRGLTETELRWLLKLEYVEHRIEATLLGDPTRCFLAQGGMKFTADSCFVLTTTGEQYVRALLHPANGPAHGHTHGLSNGHRPAGLEPQLPAAGEPTFPTPSPGLIAIEVKSLVIPQNQRPTWDPDRKELWFGPHVVKRFRFQSPNQETILIVFHEEGWPAKIDDPLPPVPNQTSRQRLHDAIKNLNRHRLNRVIRFAGDGTGEGVLWERVELAANDE